MDPITHGLVGLAIASVSGEPILGAVSIGAALAAMSPDLDIIMQCRGHLSYLKNHRGVSHSLPFLMGISIIIAIGLTFIFPEIAFLKVLFWTFIGALSHSLLDLLNSYGAKLLWPIREKRYSGGLLLSFDPVIIGLSLYMILSNQSDSILDLKVGIIFFGYLIMRWILKKNIYQKMFYRFGEEIQIKNIELFPSMTAIHKLHFIVETTEKFIVGEVNVFNKQFQIQRELEKAQTPIYEQVLHSIVGEFFHKFTPIYHMDIQDKGDHYCVIFTDLRFFIKNEFIYHATAILSKDLKTIEGVFHPYSFNQKVSII